MRHWFPITFLSLWLVPALAASASSAENPAQAGTVPAALDFAVFRGDDEIGRHRVAFRREGGSLIAEIEIELTVSFAFIDLFRYRHVNREVWRGGKLVALETETDDNGRLYSVSATATPEGLRVRAGDREFIAPADIMPTSYWHPETPERRRFLDTQHGRLIDLEIAEAGHEEVEVDGLPVFARRYAVGGDLRMALWYAEPGRWLGVAFAARGAEVRYRARSVDMTVAHRALNVDGH